MKKILLSAAFIAVSFTTFSQVAVGTTSPDASAALDVTSTIQGFLPPRMTQAQMNAIAAPAEGLIVYCSDCIPKGIYVNTGDGSTGDSGSSGFVSITNGEGSGTDTTTEIVDLISSTTGRIWMDRNLGATQVADSLKDVAAAGDLYQWGRSKDGHQSKSSGITTTRATSATPGHGKFVASGDWTDIDKTGLWQDGLNDPCPTGYRVPTIEEISAETVDAFPSSADGVNSVFAALKLPYTGYRHIDGSFQFSNTFYDSPPYIAGIYWSSTAHHNYNIQQGLLQYLNTNTHNSDGLAIRCIKKRVNESATDTETEIHDIVSPTTQRTWMDRNLGAEEAADNLTHAAAYGDLYQWGRGKDGHESRISSTTNTIARSARAGHDKFISPIDIGAATDHNWTDFAGEDALWPTGLNDPCPSGYRIPTGPELEAELDGFNNATGVFAALKIPLAGDRYLGDLRHVGVRAYLWSSTVLGPNYLYTKNVDGGLAVVNMSSYRDLALPIRCIKKE